MVRAVNKPSPACFLLAFHSVHLHNIFAQSLSLSSSISLSLSLYLSLLFSLFVQEIAHTFKYHFCVVCCQHMYSNFHKHSYTSTHYCTCSSIYMLLERAEFLYCNKYKRILSRNGHNDKRVRDNEVQLYVSIDVALIRFITHARNMREKIKFDNKHYHKIFCFFT